MSIPLLLLLALSSLARFPCLMLRAFSHLAFLMLSSFALLALAHLLSPSHPFLEFCREQIFGVAKQLGKVNIIVLPEVWE